MIGRIASLLVTGLTLATAPSVAAQGLATMVGQEWVYQVKPKDTLSRIAARHQIPQRAIRDLNRLAPTTRLQPGQTLRLTTRRIVPPAAKATLVIDIPDLRLYRYQGDRLQAWYPVALGQPFDTRHAEDPARWQTPTGNFQVVELRQNPVWRVPKSIQAEMAAEGKRVYERMPPGPENPLGKYWIGLSRWGYGLHGTIAPTSVGRYKTHGCIRMKPGHIERVFRAVKLGSLVRISYEPVKVATLGSQVWLEVAPDTYRKVPDMEALVHAKLRAAGVLDRIDARRVEQVTRDQWGLAVRVDEGLVPPAAPASLSPPSVLPTLPALSLDP